MKVSYNEISILVNKKIKIFFKMITANKNDAECNLYQRRQISNNNFFIKNNKMKQIEE